MKPVALYGPNGHLIVTDPAKPDEAARALKALARAARGAFKSADSTRLNANWSASNEHINTILNRELRTLRARSRWLENNNPYMAAGINQLTHYCVGTGFDLQMAVAKGVQTADGYELQELDGFNDFVEDVWGEWCEDANIGAPAGCPDHFADVQALLCRRIVVDGEVLVHLVPDQSNPSVPLYLELIDADNLDTTLTEYQGNPVFLGVEVNRANWRPVAYWVYTSRQNDPALPARVESLRIPANDMVHVFRKRYPGQLRGIPFCAGVAQRFFDLDEYSAAQLIRNKIAAAFGVLLKNSDGGSLLSETEASDTTDADGFPTDSSGNILANIAPGIIGKLPKGVEPVMVNPTAPESSFEPFVNSMLQAIGAGMEVGLSYTALTRDTSRTTYSGGRQAENMDAQAYRPFMAFFARKALSPIFRRWMDMAVLSGIVTAPTYSADPRFWQRHRWMPSGWTRGINPTQEVAASEQSMKNYTTSLAEECAWYGRDWKAVLRQAAKIERMKAQLGLPAQLFTAPKPAAAPSAATEDDDASEVPEELETAK